MKVAIPIWEGKVSPVFDTASRLRVLQVDREKEASSVEVYMDERDMRRKCLQMQGLGVDTLICGAISRYFKIMLKESGIHVIPWISGSADEVLEAYLSGTLYRSKFLMPGCHWPEEEA